MTSPLARRRVSQPYGHSHPVRSLICDIPEVLFVCVHNASRSQMAAALLAGHTQGRVVVRSAGSTPAETINPAVVTAMAEIEIPRSSPSPSPRRPPKPRT